MFRVALASTLLVLGACGSSPAPQVDLGVADAAVPPSWEVPDFAHADAAMASGLSMVTDVNTRSPAAGVTTYMDFAGAVWFGANGPMGSALYKSDGTVAGTTLAIDFSADDSFAPSPVAVLGNQLVITRFGASAGVGLWLTDGSAAGTKQLFGHGFASTLGVIGNTLYFTAVDGGTVHLFRSDGTVAGTSAVSSTITIARAAIVGSVIWISGTSPAAGGNELYKSDGTSAGTVLVKDIYPGATGSNPGGFTLLGGKVVFIATDDTHGSELWSTDGTLANTNLVLDINTGTANGMSSIAGFAPAIVGGYAYFLAVTTAAGAELWRSDGTAANTTMVKDIEPGATGSSPTQTTVLGTKVVFSVTTAATGRELWITDGTSANTTEIMEIGPGTADGVNVVAGAVKDGFFYFGATDGTHGRELWRTDGTAANTMLVDDLFAGARGTAAFLKVVTLRNRLWFTADDTMRDQAAYTSDGTAAGTIALPVGNASATSGSLPHGAARLGTKLVFFATDELTGNELYITDGTTTTRLTDLMPGAADGVAGGLTTIGDVAYFRGRDPTHGLELWKTDGTSAGTTLVADVNPGVADGLDQADAPVAIQFGAQVVFRATNGTQGFEPWATTAGTTTMLTDLDPGVGDGMEVLTNPVVLGGSLYFNGYDSPTSPGAPPLNLLDEGLFRYDGVTFTRLTPDDTRGTQIQLFNGTVYFVQGSIFLGGGGGLCKTDGTKVGTTLVTGVAPIATAQLGGKLALATSGLLFATDGTGAGTKLVSTDGPPGGSPYFGLTTFGTQVYYLGGNGTDGLGLWSSDLTTAQLVTPLAFGNFPAIVPIVAKQRLYFVAAAQDVGQELFVSDGTAAGTKVVGDGRPGVLGSNPTILSATDDDIYLSMDDGVHGLELWRLAL